jgi:ABC-type glycerol-3-phosphate transport system substrate-binding protein
MTARAAAGLTVGLIGLLSCAAIGERVVSRQGRADRVTVVYWEKWTGQEGEEMRKVVDAFNRSQDRVFVKYLSISGVDQKTLLATAGGDPPDIAGVWQEQVAQFSDAGALTDLTPLAQAAGLTPDYYIKGFYEPLTYQGKLWALPSTPASIALCVRSDFMPPAFDTPEEFPKTIEEMDDLVKKVSKKRSDGSIELAGFLPSSPGWWNWAWGNYFGGRLVDGDTITVNGPESVRAFTWIQSYAKLFGAKEVQNLQSGFGNFASPQDPFMSGKTAMEQNGVWKGNYIRVYRPETKWFAVPFPYPADHPQLAEHANLSQDVLVIPRGSKHVQEAFEFIRFVQRQDVMEGLCSAHGKNSPLAKVSEKFFATHPNPYIRLFDRLARSPNAFYAPRIGMWPQLSGEIGNAFQEVNTGQKEPKQALDDAQARVDKLWATYQRQILHK